MIDACLRTGLTLLVSMYATGTEDAARETIKESTSCPDLVRVTPGCFDRIDDPNQSVRGGTERGADQRHPNLGSRAAGEISAVTSGTLDTYRRALQTVEAGLEFLGGVSALSNGLVLRGEGIYDLSTRLQGKHADVSEPVPWVERLAIEVESERLSYESDSRVNSDTAEHLRYQFDGAGRMLLVDLINGRAFWDASPAPEDHRQRYVNMVPHLLLAHALEQRKTLQHLGRIQVDGEAREAVAFTRPTGEVLTLLFDPDTGGLTGAEYLLDMPLLGDTRVRWTYLPYEQTEVGLYPRGYRVTLGDRELKRVEYTALRSGATAPAASGLFVVPEDITVPEAPDVAPGRSEQTAGSPSEAPLPEPRELADGVYLVPNIRSGFHPLLVELSDGLLVVDAPTGWYEMQQLPAMNWVAGESSSSVGKRLLEVARRTVPGKPVRWLVLSHHHSDHAGGVRPFIDAGVTIVAAPETAAIVEEAARRSFTLAPDPLTGRSVEPQIEVVRGKRTITGKTRSVWVLDVGANPHVDGMLAVFLPDDSILYVADLFEPLPDHLFPSLGRLPTMRWFVDWLDRAGLEPERIYAIHGAARVTEEQIEEVRRLGGADEPATIDKQPETAFAR